MSALNSICPYFTMFPLAFPSGIIKKYLQEPGGCVLDPFCGRGTTNYSARENRLFSIGIDSNPVAYSISLAKIANTSPDRIMKELHNILNSTANYDVPSDEFWEMVYHPHVLREICKIRSALIDDCFSDERVALRGIILGALHGGLTKTVPSYLSNQAPRTYSPKPAYSIGFWKARGLCAPDVDVCEIIKRRAEKYYSPEEKVCRGMIIEGDCTKSSIFNLVKDRLERENKGVSLVITSPPYYGMNTYITDQWIRNWFIGGSSKVDYSKNRQIEYNNPKDFANILRSVWSNCASVSNTNTKMFIRLGAIRSADSSPLDILESSLDSTSWEIKSIESAGDPPASSRQANSFNANMKQCRLEIDAMCECCLP